RKRERREQFATLENVAPRSGAELSNRNRATPLRAGDVAGDVIGNERRDGIRGRRRVAQIATDACPTLNLPAADDAGRVDQARIGGTNLLVAIDPVAGNRGSQF